MYGPPFVGPLAPVKKNIGAPYTRRARQGEQQGWGPTELVSTLTADSRRDEAAGPQQCIPGWTAM